MAFFGITHLGYQNPIGDNLIACPSGPARLWGTMGTQSREARSVTPEQQQGSPRTTEEGATLQKPRPFSSEIHQGSYSRHQEMIRHVKTPRSPNELYLTPLTNNQQYGWLLSQTDEPWRQVKRFPMKNSEMTTFVAEMTKSDPEFTLF